MKDKYTFRECTLSIMDDIFGLRATLNSPTLDSWLQMTPLISDDDKIVLNVIQRLLLLNRDAWNEQELSLHFIGPMFGLASFTELYRFNLFAERHIGSTVPSVEGNVELSWWTQQRISSGTDFIPGQSIVEFVHSLCLNKKKICWKRNPLLCSSANHRFR